MRRRHASHITVVLSKTAHSGPSVCLRARAPCPLRVSCPGADRALYNQSEGQSVQCELQVFALPWPLGYKTGSSPDVQLTHGTGRTVALPYSVPRYTSLRTVGHMCVCARSTAVFHGVYGRSALSFDDFAVLTLTRLHFSPVFPRFVSFKSRTPRVNMSNNDKANGYNALKVPKWCTSELGRLPGRRCAWLRMRFGRKYPLSADGVRLVLFFETAISKRDVITYS